MHTQQQFFGDRSLIVMLALLSSFPPLSTDLYLPALPHVIETLGATQTSVNLSLSLFLVSFASGILLWGPISEKLGRKPILLTGLVIYTLGSAACALSNDVTTLIIARMAQGFGGGAAQAVAAAMVKDLFSGRRRELVLAVVMAMVIIAPVIAPVAGAFILQFTSWKVLFWILTGVGALALTLSLFLTETLQRRYQGSVLDSLGRLGVVMKNPGFSVLLFMFSLVPLPLLTFIGASAFIYIKGFGMSEQAYGYYFALNALGALAGPLLYIQISKWISAGQILAICFGLLALSGSLLEISGSASPMMFAIPMLIATLSITLMRPPTANLMLSQQDEDTGSAASLISFATMTVGSIGMLLISFVHVDKMIANLGLIQIIVGVGCGGMWLLLRNKTFIRKPQ